MKDRDVNGCPQIRAREGMVGGDWRAKGERGGIGRKQGHEKWIELRKKVEMWLGCVWGRGLERPWGVERGRGL